jgi:hypothetical protein
MHSVEVASQLCAREMLTRPVRRGWMVRRIESSSDGQQVEH